MSIIVLAGGSGSVGKTIAEALVQHGKHEVVVLSRRVSGSCLLPNESMLTGPSHWTQRKASIP